MIARNRFYFFFPFSIKAVLIGCPCSYIRRALALPRQRRRRARRGANAIPHNVAAGLLYIVRLQTVQLRTLLTPEWQLMTFYPNRP